MSSSLSLRPSPGPSPRGLLAALALALVAGSGCPPDDGSVPQAFPVLEDGATPPAAAAPTDDKEILRICTILPSSGVSKDIGAEIRRGIDIARSELGTGTKRRYEWTDKDTKSTEPGALAAFQECFNEGHHVVIGPVHPAAVTALIPVAAAHDILVVIPELGAAVPSVWSPNLVAIAPTATEMGRLAGRNARVDRGFTKAGVLHVPKIFGESLRDAFSKEFLGAEEGGTIVGSRELAPDDPEAWAAAAKELMGKGAEALFVVGPPEPSKAVAAAVADAKTHVWFVDWAMHPPVLAAAGDKARSHVHWMNRTLPRGPFEAVYRERHQARPEYSAGAGYDAVTIVSLASEASKSTWHEDLGAEIGKLTGIPSAFGTGAMVRQGDILYLDLGGYRLIEPVPLPDTDEWVFGGFE